MIGSPLPSRSRHFWRRKRFAPIAVPRSLAKPGSSSRELYASTESSRSVPALDPLGPELLPWGWRPSSRHQPAASCTGLPPPAPSVLGVSHALDGLIRCWPRGFISPRCHVPGSTLQGVPLPAQPNRFITGSCPLVGWLQSPTNGCPFAPASTAPPSRPCSMPRVRCVPAGVTRRAARSPRGLRPPPGLPSSHRREHLRALFRPWPWRRIRRSRTLR